MCNVPVRTHVRANHSHLAKAELAVRCWHRSSISYLHALAKTNSIPEGLHYLPHRRHATPSRRAANTMSHWSVEVDLLDRTDPVRTGISPNLDHVLFTSLPRVMSHAWLASVLTGACATAMHAFGTALQTSTSQYCSFYWYGAREVKVPGFNVSPSWSRNCASFMWPF